MAMMLGWITIGALVSLTAMQTVYVWIYCRFLRSSDAAPAKPLATEPESADRCFPKTAVILCLRGVDPNLRECLCGILTQNIENYELHLVMDDERDPAMDLVRELDTTNDGVSIKTHVFDHRRSKNCSLKCAALTSVISSLDESIDVIALIDADTIADPNWLGDLLAPMADATVGATTGNRWFAPEENSLGSLVRQTWNAAAIAQMSFYQIAWGGSLAIKRSAIEQCNLIDAWNAAFCEDTMLTGALKTRGLRVVRVPGLIIPNRESSSLRDAFRWITRQLLTVRLYHRDWPLVLAHGLFSAACLLGALVATAWLIPIGQARFAAIVFSVLLGYEIINALLLRAIQIGNQAAMTRRGFELPDSPTNLPVKWFALLTTQFVHPLAAITAALTRQVSWRGISYSIEKNNSIKRGSYRPYREIVQPRTDSDSTQNSID